MIKEPHISRKPSAYSSFPVNHSKAWDSEQKNRQSELLLTSNNLFLIVFRVFMPRQQLHRWNGSLASDLKQNPTGRKNRVRIHYSESFYGHIEMEKKNHSSNFLVQSLYGFFEWYLKQIQFLYCSHLKCALNWT